MTNIDPGIELGYRRQQVRHRFEIESVKRAEEVQQLFQIAQNDSTVNTFLNNWMSGGFPSFEAMLLQLVDYLATEKAKYLQQAVVNWSNQPPQPVDFHPNNGVACIADFKSLPACPLHATNSNPT